MLRFSWAHAPIYFGFGEEYDREPVGWKDSAGNVHDHWVPDSTEGNWHRGTDFPFPVGTPIQNALAGTCTYADWSDLGYGFLVTVQGGRYKCRYAHLSSILVRPGQHIKGGEVIGLSGATGNVTGPHLHFEVYDSKLDSYIDPFH